jgi:protocatechuate 3,4-dioxygenase beta subunit
MLRVLALAVLLSACQAEDAGRGPGAAQAAAPSRPDLYACEGCEGALEREAGSLGWQARIAGPDEPGERLLVRGTVLRGDGVTPAPDVVVYAYHTNAAGLYAGGSPETEWSRRHGRLRGWVRTGADGRYEFTTVKPGRYPDRTDPAHLHLTVVEPGRRPYWIDDIVFAGEPGVDAAYRAERENRGGPGIVTLQRLDDGAWLAKRNIVLERHPG